MQAQRAAGAQSPITTVGENAPIIGRNPVKEAIEDWLITRCMAILGGGVSGGGLQNVSEELGKPPSSVTNQYVAPNFADPWPDEIGSATMSISGLTTSTINGDTFVSGDGSSDYGTASSENIGAQTTYGLAFTFKASSSNVSDFDTMIGTAGPNFNYATRFRVYQNEMEASWRENGNKISVTGGTIADGSVHTVIVNKTGDTAGDFEIYVDDMSSDVSSIRTDDGGLDSSNYSHTGDYGFWVVNQGSGSDISDHIQADMATIEIGTEPYSESQRHDFRSRRPEV